MKQTLARFIYKHINGFRPNPHLMSSSPSLSSQKIRLLTSKSHGVVKQNPFQEQNKDEPVNEADVSNKELKKSIERFMEGDEEAIPSILQAILKRKLAGTGDESDDKLMKELGDLPPPVDDVSGKEFDSDHDEL